MHLILDQNANTFHPHKKTSVLQYQVLDLFLVAWTVSSM